MNNKYKCKLGDPFIVSTPPIAQILSINYKKYLCDYCYKRFEEIDKCKIKCKNCNNSYYCSDGCMKNDYCQHELECKFKLMEKIQKSFKIHENYSYDDYYSKNDLIDIFMLFFRMLKQYPLLKQDVNDVAVELEWQTITKSSTTTTKRFCSSSYRLKNYFERFNELNDDELFEIDEIIGLDLSTKQQTFEWIMIENNVKYCLNEIINNIVDNDDDDDKTNDHSSSQDSLSDILDPSILLDDDDDDFYYVCKTKNNDDDDNNDISISSSNGGEYKYNIDLNNYVKEIIVDNNRDEQQVINMLKTEYRRFFIEEYLEKWNKECNNKFEFYYNTWLDIIFELLYNDDKCLYNYLQNPINNIDVMKILFITIRYSIAITDEITTYSIGRAIYSTLIGKKHCCLSNTSIIFNANCLNVYYLAPNQIKLDLNTDTDTDVVDLDLNEISIDFNHEISTKEDCSTIFNYNRLRFLNCQCKRCLHAQKLSVKKYYHNSILRNILNNFNNNKFRLNQLSQEVWDILNNDELMNDYYRDYSHNCDQLIFNYDECIKQLIQIFEKYGNRFDLKYTIRIEEILVETMQTFRTILSYYHPQITLILMQIILYNLIIIKSSIKHDCNYNHCKKYCKIFFRYIYLHQYLIQLQQSITITHGRSSDWSLKMNQVHTIMHSLLLDLFNNDKIKLFIQNIDKHQLKNEVKFNLIDSNDNNNCNCNELIYLSYNDLNIIIDIIDKDETLKNDNDDERIKSMNYNYLDPYFDLFDYSDDYFYRTNIHHMNNNDELMNRIPNPNDNYDNKTDELLSIFKEIFGFQSLRIY